MKVKHRLCAIFVPSENIRTKINSRRVESVDSLANSIHLPDLDPGETPIGIKF
jgi:hypothetical protein